jgi:flagellar motor switch protein FliM
MEPLNKKAICDIDPIFAAMIVEYMLGGEPSAQMRMDKQSDTELGVIQYLILQVLSNVHKTSGKNPRVYFRFDRFATDGGILDIARPKDKVAILVFRASIGEYAGFMRLVLPDPFVETFFLNAASPEVKAPEEVQYQLDQMSKFGFVDTSLWAEGGRTTLSPSELSGIEEGDIVVFERGGLKLSEKGPYGRVRLRVGSGEAGGFEAELNTEGKEVHCKITSFHKGE